MFLLAALVKKVHQCLYKIYVMIMTPVFSVSTGLGLQNYIMLNHHLIIEAGGHILIPVWTLNKPPLVDGMEGK